MFNRLILSCLWSCLSQNPLLTCHICEFRHASHFFPRHFKFFVRELSGMKGGGERNYSESVSILTSLYLWSIGVHLMLYLWFRYFVFHIFIGLSCKRILICDWLINHPLVTWYKLPGTKKKHKLKHSDKKRSIFIFSWRTTI